MDPRYLLARSELDRAAIELRTEDRLLEELEQWLAANDQPSRASRVAKIRHRARHRLYRLVQAIEPEHDNTEPIEVGVPGVHEWPAAGEDR